MTEDRNDTAISQPNILFITVDQMRYPDFSDEHGGMIQPLKEIFGFTELSEDNPYTHLFPGFMRLRKNAVSLQNHHIAASACVPSRTTIYTGQYGTRTRVMETDSLFKYGSDPDFPWLDPRGVPTTGDWFRAAGYTSHYFGKWDLSFADIEGPNKGNINAWGFSDWKLSSPDAQGGQLNQLGVYRDPGYADMASSFLKRKGMNYEDTPDKPKPWFAAVSIVNPHDIASAYPISWWMPETLDEDAPSKAADHRANFGVQTIPDGGPTDDPDTPKPVPSKQARSNPLPGGTSTIALNPTGFGTDETLFNNPESLHDDLITKPDCQFDYSYKMGLALKSRRPEPLQKWQTLPFQSYADQGDQAKTDEWFQAYGQFYTYLHTLADRQIDQVLRTLDETGLAENTIVVFLSDHGEYGGVQGGMIEKWHTAYDQILRVPVVFSNPTLNVDEDTMKSVDQLTSHIDILPTLLGFTDFNTEAKQHGLGLDIKRNFDQTYIPLPGVNLVPTLKDPDTLIYCSGPDSTEQRSEILFITDDTITDHLVGQAPSLAYINFMKAVDDYRNINPRLHPGPVVQPNHIRCIKWTIMDSDDQALNDTTWKLAKYWDPAGKEDDQWEFYSNDNDPSERNNLVTWGNSKPLLVTERIDNSWGLSDKDVQQALKQSRKRLKELEERYLKPVSPIEQAYVLERRG
ncbi:MAG: arylsulfatase A-like enzyme [Arenicella sp.]|jgi:arylsulfatase A-like enzyme